MILESSPVEYQGLHPRPALKYMHAFEMFQMEIRTFLSWFLFGTIPFLNFRLPKGLAESDEILNSGCTVRAVMSKTQ